MKYTIDAISKTPAERFVNLAITEICESTALTQYTSIRLDRSPIITSANITAIVSIAAASWFSVREETNIPIEIKVIPTSRSASTLPMRLEVFTCA